jgi:RND superfamily putative drug exporter
MSATLETSGSIARHTLRRRSAMYRLGRWTATNPIKVILVWLVLLACATVSASSFTSHLTGNGNEVTGSDSQAAKELVEDQFPVVADETDLVVVHSGRLTTDDEPFRRAVDTVVARFDGHPGVVSVLSPYTAPDRMISADRRTAIIPVGLTGTPKELRQAVGPLEDLAAGLGTTGIDVSFTGSSPLAAAGIDQGTADLSRAESIGFPAAAIVMLIAFGSLVAAGIPLLLGVVTVLASFGVLGVAAMFTPFDVFVQTAVTMVAIAVGIDYSLFIVTRFREELARAGDRTRRGRAEAVGQTMATAGQAVLFSGITVVFSLAGLLLVRAPNVHSMALGMAAAVLTMMVIAVTALPAVLGLLGGKIDSLALPGIRRSRARPESEHSVWTRLADLVMRRAVLTAVVVTLGLSALALPVFGLRYGVDLGASTLKDSKAGRSYDVVSTSFAPGVLTPISVIAYNRPGLLTDDQLDAVSRFTAGAESDTRVSEVVSITDVLDDNVRGHTSKDLAQVLMVAHDPVRDLVSAEGSAAVIAVWSRFGADTEQTAALVRELRVGAAAAFAPVGLITHTGGLPAQIVDVTDESTRAMPLVVGFVLAASWLLLLLAFRSLLLPFVAIFMNLLTSGAAFGVAVLVFQDGHGAGLLGVDRTGFIQVIVPLFAFALVFGLSMDYQVFMLSRMREEWDRTRDSALAVRAGITRTARVITAAAAIMLVVFAAFMFTRNLEIKQMGFMLALAVLIDATVVRLLLMLSVIRLMGPWAWWMPGRRPAG